MCPCSHAVARVQQDARRAGAGRDAHALGVAEILAVDGDVAARVARRDSDLGARRPARREQGDAAAATVTKVAVAT